VLRDSTMGEMLTHLSRQGPDSKNVQRSPQTLASFELFCFPGDGRQTHPEYRKLVQITMAERSLSQHSL
jgi:hypothetical protein